MLTYEDCQGLCDLTEEEVAAIAEHEHIPQMAAAAMGNYLVHLSDGIPRLKAIIRDDIADARAQGDHVHAAKLVYVLRHFVETHPEHNGGNDLVTDEAPV